MRKVGFIENVHFGPSRREWNYPTYTNLPPKMKLLSNFIIRFSSVKNGTDTLKLHKDLSEEYPNFTSIIHHVLVVYCRDIPTIRSFLLLEEDSLHLIIKHTGGALTWTMGIIIHWSRFRCDSIERENHLKMLAAYQKLDAKYMVLDSDYKFVATPQSDDFLREYEANPRLVSYKLRCELGINKEYSADLYALVFFVEQGYYRCRSQEVANFFELVLKLPVELQMLVCNLSQGVANLNYISTSLVSKSLGLLWLRNK